MIVLGIDPGTRITGYGLLSDEQRRYKVLDYGTIRTPTQASTEKRYLIIYESVEALLQRYQPQALAVETQYVHKNVQSAIKLGMARGVVIVAAAKNGVPVFEYSPTKAKKAVVGNGRASKIQVQCMMQTLLNLPSLPEPADAADALALALCHMQNQTIRNRQCTNT